MIYRRKPSPQFGARGQQRRPVGRRTFGQRSPLVQHEETTTIEPLQSPYAPNYQRRLPPAQMVTRRVTTTTHQGAGWGRKPRRNGWGNQPAVISPVSPVARGLAPRPWTRRPLPSRTMPTRSFDWRGLSTPRTLAPELQPVNQLPTFAPTTEILTPTLAPVTMV